MRCQGASTVRVLSGVRAGAFAVQKRGRLAAPISVDRRRCGLFWLLPARPSEVNLAASLMERPPAAARPRDILPQRCDLQRHRLSNECWTWLRPGGAQAPSSQQKAPREGISAHPEIAYARAPKTKFRGRNTAPILEPKAFQILGRIFSFPLQLRIEGPEYGPDLGTKNVPVLGPQIGHKGVDFGTAAAHVHG